MSNIKWGYIGESVALTTRNSQKYWFAAFAAIGLITIGDTANPQPPPPSSYSATPDAACVAAGGKYLGEMKCQMADGHVSTILSIVDVARSLDSKQPVTPGSPNAWALATTAIIFEVNGDRQDLLAGEVVSPESEKGGKQLLSEWWGIENRDEFFKTLKWLQFSGHREAFEELGQFVDAMTDQQYMAALAEDRANGLDTRKLEVVRQNYRQFGQKGILGWDIIRYISLCRWGYLAGYWEVYEAWQHIMPAALLLQRSFTSWQDLQTNYLIGREFWSPTQTEKDGDKFRAVYDRFMSDPGSPWNLNPWSMNLGDKIAPLPIKPDARALIPPP